jgi:hypothetical protein
MLPVGLVPDGHNVQSVLFGFNDCVELGFALMTESITDTE